MSRELSDAEFEEFLSKAMAFMEAQREAEDAGKNQFVCPICGGTAWWDRSISNNHLHAGCEKCGFVRMT